MKGFVKTGVLLQLLVICSGSLLAQSGETLTLDLDEQQQTVEGFGASLAFYESWLIAHKQKDEIYDAIFGELSLDILRVRTAYDYDPSMLARVKEFMDEAEASLGHPIKLLATSWGPPGYLKNTGDRKNGGTLRYDIVDDRVVFDYGGFADWWAGALDEYASVGIQPDFLNFQNEPNWTATWETCRFSPSEKINATDTIAGYNRALDSIWAMVQEREHKPLILGPETVGIGYNQVQNYVNALDLSKLDGIAHHLYNGVDENDPWSSAEFAKLGNFHPEVPHYQTEYSRGDWFSLGGLIWKSFFEEKVVAYLYWDLVWPDKGLIDIDNPWQSSTWFRTKEYYAFKQYSAFIHPGWKMVGHSATGTTTASLTFVSPNLDSATCVIVNRSEQKELDMRILVPGYMAGTSEVFVTSATENCVSKGSLQDSAAYLAPYSITTVSMELTPYDPDSDYDPPSIPEGLAGLDIGEDELTLVWEASEDVSGVAHYQVFMDSEELGSTPDTFMRVTGLEPMTSYSFQLCATDVNGFSSELSEPISLITLYFDRTPPVLSAGDSIYQEGQLEVSSNEDGMLYLVAADTPSGLEQIRAASLDSAKLEADISLDLPVSGLENGAYWLYATDSAWNLSEPAGFEVYGVGVSLQLFPEAVLWPNPADRDFHLSFWNEKEAAVELRILDLQGRQLWVRSWSRLPSGQQQLFLERGSLAPGTYLLQLTGSGNTQSLLLLLK